MHGLNTLRRLNVLGIRPETKVEKPKKLTAAEKLAEKVAAVQVGDRYKDNDRRMYGRTLEVGLVVHSEGQKFGTAVLFVVDDGGKVRRDLPATKVRLDRLVTTNSRGFTKVS